MKKSDKFCAVSMLLLATSISSVAVAESELAIDEIVVTANKRSAESLQDIAGSIQAIGSETMEQLGTEGFDDYIKLVPGLTAVSSGTGQSQIVIRGINSQRIDHQAGQSRSLAGIYIDDMPISLAGFNPDLNLSGIERVEVLRGPQGTLYGASSMSGTVRIVTRMPDPDRFDGKIRYRVSFTEDGDPSYGLDGSFNLPVNDNMAATVSAWGSRKGGYIDNVAPGFEEADYNEEDTHGFRAKLAWLGEDLTLALSAIYQDFKADGRPDEYHPASASDSAVTQVFLGPVTGELQTVKFVRDTFANEFLGLNLFAEYDAGDYTLVSATSYFDSDTTNDVDDTFRFRALLGSVDPNAIGQFTNPNTLESIVQEFRISSNFDGRVNFIAGLFYEDAERDLGPRRDFSNGFDAMLALAGGPPPASAFGVPADSIFWGYEDTESTQTAFFGELTVGLTDELELVAGGRWYDYENDVEQVAGGLVTGNGGQPAVNKGVVEEDGFIPKISLTYQPTEDVTLYGTYVEGFRLGGINEPVPSECNSELNSLGLPQGSPFLSDEIKNVEVGAKTSWMDNRLLANVSVYRIDWSDIQSQIALKCDFTILANAGDLENTGVEADFAFQATEDLTLRLGLAYVDSEVVNATPLINMEGDEPPYVSDLTVSASAEYAVEVFGGEGFVRGDVRHVSSSKNEFSSRASALTLDSHTVFDLTVGCTQDLWNYSVFARNLFDEEVVTNIDPDRRQPSQFTRGRPRTIGFSVSRSF